MSVQRYVTIHFTSSYHYNTTSFRKQGGSETSNVVQVGDSGADEKTGGGDGGGRVEYVAIFIGSDENGQDQE